MARTATANRRKPRLDPAPVELVEAYSLSSPASGPKLRIDKEAGIIYGAKLGGRFSRNCHGIAGVTQGTEYTPAAYKAALPLYEGLKVHLKHLPRKGQPAGDRGPFDYFGVIRDPWFDDAAGCPRGDFHYRKTHPDAPQLVEDIERGMGGFGFSHHIPPGGYTGKVINGRLVVQAITEIKSVDLVDDPATTRNLWEGREPTVQTTLKELVEKYVADKSPARKAVARALTEEGDDPAMTAPMDMPAAADSSDAGDTAGDPEDELWAGFMSAIIAILNGDGAAADKAKQIGKYLKAHEKLTATAEPAPADDSSSDDGEPKESRETHELKAKIACLESGLKNPSPALLKALTLMDSEADRKALIEQTRQASTIPARRPTSGAPRPGGAPSRGLAEGKVPVGDAFRRSIKE